ncbi:MAG: helix-turn-helix domain-containing protein [Bacteroidia bacterium]|nr:helix-turn-helix domain-containing protein [Bacteroidia bacterium]
MNSKIVVMTEEDILLLIKKAFDDLSIAEKLGEKERPGEQGLFDVKEAAEFLKMKVPTLYGLTSKREIPFFKKGKRIYFKKDELLEWVDAGRKKTRREIQSEVELRSRRRG